MSVELGMIVVLARDLRESIQFYRRLGLEVPDPDPGRPVSLCRMPSGVSVVIVEEGFADRVDPHRLRAQPNAYQHLWEFVVDDDASVDTAWSELTTAGHHGRKPPGKETGVYAAMVDDPDGNVLLISADPVARPRPAG